MNTLDMPMSYVPALEEQEAPGKDVPMEGLPVDLLALIDDCPDEWAADDGEDLLAALGGESYEQLLEEGVTLLDGGCGLGEEEVLDFVTEEVAAAPCADAEPEADAEPQADAAEPEAECDATDRPSTPRRNYDPFLTPALSPFSLKAIESTMKPDHHPSVQIWEKFGFPVECQMQDNPEVGFMEYAEKFRKKNIPDIDWDAEMAYYEAPEERLAKRSAVKECRNIMWSPQYELVHRPKPMPTAAQLRRKLEEDDDSQDAGAAVTPDNSLPLANRSTTVPAASALKARPMRSLLNTKQQPHVAKTSSRSLLLPSARSRLQAAAAGASSLTVVKQKTATATSTTTCDPVPPAESSVEIKASRSVSSEDETVSASSRPETPQSQTDSEDEAPVFRHNTIDTIFSSTLCDASSSTVYLTPSDSSGSPKSAFCDDDDDDEDEEEEEEEEDYEHQNLRSPPESVIREERPARTVLPYISDHSYHLSKSNVRIDGLGVQTPSDSEEEIDVVSVGGDKGTARLPNNPSARDRRQIQIKVASAIQRQSRQQQAAAEPPGSRKRQASATPTRAAVKRTRAPPAPLALGRAPGKGRGRRRANADEEPDPCEKRSMHNNMERQRRIDLRNLVERLRLTVPATEDNKRAAKVVILREAAKLCRELAARADAQEADKARLRARQADLQRRLSGLRTELAAQRMRDRPAPCFGEDYFTAVEVKPEPEDYHYYRQF